MRVMTTLAVLAGLLLPEACLANEAETKSGWTLRTGDEPLHALAKQRLRGSVMVFGGPMVSARLGRIFEGNLDDGISPAGFLGFAGSYEIARRGPFSVELEGGVGGLFGRRRSVTSPQVWLAAFGRYDGFPWNDYVRTSVAASVGVNWSHRRSTSEHTREGPTKRLLHYLAPEISFAAPSRPDQELVARLHHRSSVWGLFGCKRCALNVLTLGLRQRF